VDLVPEHVERALTYVHLLNGCGLDPSRSRVEDFARTQPPAGPRRALLPESWLVGIGVARPAEPVVGYLTAMGWADIIPGPAENVHLTPLGEAFLLGLEPHDGAEADTAVADVVLEPQDPLVYVHLTRYLAQAGAGMLVDPYFKAESVPWLAETTSICRVLVSSRHPQAERELKLLGVALATVPNAAQLDVRHSSSKELHDRCVISEEGSIRIIGSSVTGVGKNLTSVITPTSEVARIYHDKYEKLWNTATAVTPRSPGGPDIRTRPAETPP
jgi:hypothetical protein